jgi:hypothetical protein
MKIVKKDLLDCEYFVLQPILFLLEDSMCDMFHAYKVEYTYYFI